MSSAPLAAALMAVLIATAAASIETSAAGADSFDSPAGLVVLKGRINGRFEVRLLLDTGDPTGLTLREEAARTIGLPPGQEVQRRAIGPVGSERYTLRRSRVETLEFGGIVARDLPIWIVPGTPLFAEALGTAVDGYLGVEALRDLVVTLDYPARRIRFERPGGAAMGEAAADERSAGEATTDEPETGGRAFPFRLVENRIVVEASVGDNTPRPMILDTASALTIASTADRRLTRPAPARSARLADGAGGLAALPVRALPSFALAGKVFVDLPVALYDFSAPPPGLFPTHTPPISGIVGSDILSRQVVVLDLPHQRLWLGSPTDEKGLMRPRP
jgi:hypothetical protein